MSLAMLCWYYLTFFFFFFTCVYILNNCDYMTKISIKRHEWIVVKRNLDYSRIDCIEHIFQRLSLMWKRPEIYGVVGDRISRRDRSIRLQRVLEIRIRSPATAGSIEPAGPGTGSNLNVKVVNPLFAL